MRVDGQKTIRFGYKWMAALGCRWRWWGVGLSVDFSRGPYDKFFNCLFQFGPLYLEVSYNSERNL